MLPVPFDSAFGDAGGGAVSNFGEAEITSGGGSAPQQPSQSMIVEQPIPGWMVAIQAICLLFLLAAGVIAIDIGRNMFEFDDKGTITARLTEWVLDFTGYFKSS